jgi:hypothetical protein
MRTNPIMLSLKGFLFIVIFLTFGVLANAQLKIGDNPTSINKSSLLELESSRQGLLLPRLTDTVAINSLTPPDGMIIYLNSDNSLRLRSNGVWKKIADLSEASSNWSLKGNTGTDSAANFIGTLDGRPLTLKTDGQSRLIVSSQGNIGIGTTTPSATLNVDGSVKLENLAAGTTELDVLVLAPDGSVHKRTMSSSAFENAIKAINGIQKQALTIKAETSTTENTVRVDNNIADSTIAIYLPVQDGSASKPYGFLTSADWNKIQSGLQEITIGTVAATPNADGATVSTTGTTRTITLHPADATNAGIVTAGTQTFGGDKTFNGTVTLNNVANNSTADSVLVINNGVVERRQVSSSAFGNAIRSINGNRDTAQNISFVNTGNDLTVTTNSTNAINLNVPDASTANRGVVTAAAQTFGGDKSFQDHVNAQTDLRVGTTGTANSTMQVDGSLSMSIKTVSTAYTLTGTDNTVLANTTGGAITVTLPSPASIPGRIYTIKKIGTGGLDNALTITPSGGTIDGGNSFVIYNDWTYVTLQTDGTNWYIIKK